MYSLGLGVLAPALDEWNVFIRQSNPIVSFHGIGFYVPLFLIDYIQGVQVQTAYFNSFNDAWILESLGRCILPEAVVLV
jgi:hypothetical protein